MENLTSLKVTYSIVFLSLISWAFFAYFTMNQIITTQEIYAKLINISGKQRMLSQKTTLIAKRVFETKDNKLLSHLEELILLMKDEHQFLLNNLNTQNMEDVYFTDEKDLDKEVRGYFELLDNYLKNNNDANIISQIENYSYSLLPKLDYAVNKFERESEKYTNELKNRELFILLGTLLTIFLEAILIVIPSIIKIKNTETKLKELNESLEEKLFEQKEMILKEQEEIKQKEKVFYEQSKLISMGEMIGNIAHQWRQPLSVITTIASGINLKLDYGDKIEENDLRNFTHNVHEQANYLSKTIDDFRNFIKGDQNYKKTKISDVIKNTINLVNASLKSSNITLETKIEDDITIFGNENEIQQALINIIKNAKDSLVLLNERENARVIFIETKKINRNELELTILDNGGGINDDIMDRIFEPYFTTKHASIGTGIGLSMVDKIIRERHKGLVEVKNREFTYKEKNYKGACFIVTFYKRIMPLPTLP
ncbi:hypothetical protein CRV08_14695 [Halarcobacter ebronensis]|uniref:histidine kinase n=1 Tax=Halarcobacter ebronensis TaxID=1462615 RepID=A0A4Q0Y823_9BACT|nr:ATP-binding protein [Halarcobacter ebronensis]RXJ65614.1 hypothetical protein CRV08_14695 [Halarcobacter ebronensis]